MESNPLDDLLLLRAEQEMYSEVAQGILAATEKYPDGTWRLPWHLVSGKRPENAFSGRPFRGSNVLTLWSSTRLKEFGTHLWASEPAWKANGGEVRADEKGTGILVPVVDHTARPTKWRPSQPGIKRRVGELGGDAEGGEFRRVVGYKREPWFNADQIDGVKIAPRAVPSPSEAAERVKLLQRDWKRYKGPALMLGGGMAYWRADTDRIHLPDEKAFPDHQGLSGREYFAAALAHEMVHASGSTGRLARETLDLYYKKVTMRAQEELVAELGAAFLGAEFGLPIAMRPDHAGYVKSWLSKLSEESQRGSFFAAVRAAEDAVSYILAAADGKAPRPREVRKARAGEAGQDCPF